MRVLVLTASVAAVASPAGAVADKRGRCFPRHSKTLAKSRDARVYTGLNEQFVCWYRAGKSFELTRATRLEGALQDYAPYRIAGRYLAYPVDYRDANERLLPELFVIDLRTGKVKYRSASWVVDGFGDVSIGSTKVGPLLLLRSGSAVWMSENQNEEGQLVRDVWRVDPRGAKRLDTGADVESGSLRLMGHSLTWRRGGTTKTGDIR